MSKQMSLLKNLIVTTRIKKSKNSLYNQILFERFPLYMLFLVFVLQKSTVWWLDKLLNRTRSCTKVIEDVLSKFELPSVKKRSVHIVYDNVLIQIDPMWKNGELKGTRVCKKVSLVDSRMSVEVTPMCLGEVNRIGGL